MQDVLAGVVPDAGVRPQLQEALHRPPAPLPRSQQQGSAFVIVHLVYRGSLPSISIQYTGWSLKYVAEKYTNDCILKLKNELVSFGNIIQTYIKLNLDKLCEQTNSRHIICRCPNNFLRMQNTLQHFKCYSYYSLIHTILHDG